MKVAEKFVLLLDSPAFPGHDMIEQTLESEDDEGDLVEEAKPKAKKKGKNSPATTRKERSATPDVGIYLIFCLPIFLTIKF